MRAGAPPRRDGSAARGRRREWAVSEGPEPPEPPAPAMGLLSDPVRRRALARLVLRLNAPLW